MLASGSYNGEVHLWASNGESLASLPTFSRPVFNVSFSPNGSKLLISGALPSFYVFSVADASAPSQVLLVRIDKS